MPALHLSQGDAWEYHPLRGRALGMALPCLPQALLPRSVGGVQCCLSSAMLNQLGHLGDPF